MNNTDHKKSGKPVPKSHSAEENPLTKKSEEIGVISQDVNLKREGLVKTLISLFRNTQVAISAWLKNTYSLCSIAPGRLVRNSFWRWIKERWRGLLSAEISSPHTKRERGSYHSKTVIPFDQSLQQTATHSLQRIGTFTSTSIPNLAELLYVYITW